MQTRTIGSTQVSAIGIGCAGMSVANAAPEEQSIRTIQAALDAGITLIDTAQCYIPSGDEQGHNERIIAKAIKGREAFIATKGGIKRVAGTPEITNFQTDFVHSGREDFIREGVECSLRSLEVDTIDLYQLHAPPSDVPLEETMGVFKDLIAEGKVRYAGLSNVSVEQIDLALGIVPIASVQNRFNPGDRTHAAALAHCQLNGIAFLAYSPLGGLGRGAGVGDANPAFGEVAAERGVSPQQVALAWELSLARAMVPIVGARRPESITDSAGAADIELTPGELARLAA